MSAPRREPHSSRTGRYGLLLLALGAVLPGVPPLLEAGVALPATEALFVLLRSSSASAPRDARR